jgi:hypothetical protein
MRSVGAVVGDDDGEAGVDIEVKRQDGSRTTLRVTIQPDGTIYASDPVPWEAPPSRRKGLEVKP